MFATTSKLYGQQYHHYNQNYEPMTSTNLMTMASIGQEFHPILATTISDNNASSASSYCSLSTPSLSSFYNNNNNHQTLFNYIDPVNIFSQLPSTTTSTNLLSNDPILIAMATAAAASADYHHHQQQQQKLQQKSNSSSIFTYSNMDQPSFLYSTIPHHHHHHTNHHPYNNHYRLSLQNRNNNHHHLQCGQNIKQQQSLNLLKTNLCNHQKQHSINVNNLKQQSIKTVSLSMKINNKQNKIKKSFCL